MSDAPAVDWRKRAADQAFSTVVHGIGWAVRRHPVSDPATHGIDVVQHEPYLLSGDDAHSLDIYIPRDRPGKLPAVLYIHGGSFRNLSKEQLWFAALTFARSGYVVFNLEYRRGTRYYPAALADVCAAATWVQRNGARFGADVDRLIVAGESAGANLAAALTVTCAYQRRERWARAVWDAGVRPRAAALACGILQVSEPERLRPTGLLGPWIMDCLRDAASNYLPDPDADPGNYPLADPLLVLEESCPPDRPLPPFFLGVGDRDPLAHDSHRFAAALGRLGVAHETRLYAGGVHGFHVLLPWTSLSRALWADQFSFLTRTLERPPP